MPRVKRGTIASKRRRHLLKYAKGFRWGRKSKFRAAKEGVYHAMEYAFRDRRAKKRERRQLFQLRINAATRKLGISYSRFINMLKKKNIELNRKVMSEMAREYPQVFEKIVEQAKK